VAGAKAGASWRTLGAITAIGKGAIMAIGKGAVVVICSLGNNVPVEGGISKGSITM
jgi:hypothetical protein